ncbi:hypothetical protein G7084_07505 [Weissella coleopterorum]|uniref:Putative zinc ribbon domain-containing protein n=1 Tax=Weissella coleopterorum TaxID=2714949 RepID=A0A6G8B1N6_9LACO|nr:zinc ribbon domain-containing protein [Weissella coleopterorum]QIL51147.1 hypothetical protein G7084_07505 [Weissella coleopterorum]
MEKFCQSCAMPLNTNILGTEADGSRSQKYCTQCYLNGQFVQPNLTFDEMVAIGIKGIDQTRGNRIAKWMMKKSYPMMLKNTERFKR